MTLTATSTHTYIHKGYVIDIVITKNDYEAWISMDGYGDKHMMFGMPREQQGYTEFVDIVRANIEDYMDLCDED